MILKFKEFLHSNYNEGILTEKSIKDFLITFDLIKSDEVPFITLYPHERCLKISIILIGENESRQAAAMVTAKKAMVGLNGIF